MKYTFFLISMLGLTAATVRMAYLNLHTDTFLTVAFGLGSLLCSVATGCIVIGRKRLSLEKVAVGYLALSDALIIFALARTL